MSAKAKHLVVFISGHGYGHAAMTAPLINAFHNRYPQVKITLKTGVPLSILHHTFNMQFDYLSDLSDFGMVNNNAFEVDLVESLNKYQTLHKHWTDNIENEITQLKQLEADYLLSSIAYLPLAAAKQLGLPSIAYCCLNWAEIFHHYYANQASANHIYEQMLDAYASANCFIRPEPAMPMAELNTQLVGPIATQGKNRRTQLLQSLGLPDSTKLVLATMGGIKTNMNIDNWPEIKNLHYLVPDQHAHPREDISTVSTAQISFTDILCSVDVLFTKPGYGSFTEAACNRIRVLYVERQEWPEHTYLSRWLERNTACQAISQQQLYSGKFEHELTTLLQRKTTSTAPASGLPEALELLTNHFQLN